MKKELRVYVINVDEVDDVYLPNLNDNEFADIAEQQGGVYTLNGFAHAFNVDETINSNVHVIRFIEVTI